jgi:multiple sugar transport system substrate-binding protein
MVVLTGVVMVMGCRQDIINNPRIATREASEEILPTALPTPLFSFAPTPTLGSSISDGGNTPEGLDNNHILSIWVNETSPEHQMLLNRMADSFSDRTGIQAEVQLVSPDLLPNLVQTAVISDTLPDLILHPTEFSIGWAEAGILDVELATIWLDELGRDSFYEDGLQKLKIDPSGQQVAALPSDGWKQLLIYRSDWLQELGLSQPNTYESIVAAAEGIHDPEQSRSGIVVPTESDLISTQQVFEHFALANGCDLVEESGRISILHPACLEALEYYRFLVNEYSPIGFQTDVSALNAYLTGRTGMIVTSPASIPIIAGFIEANYPTCDDCLTPDYLLNNSGFVTEITGSGEFASSEEFAGITALGVTKAADPEITKSFVNFWFGEGYLDWISVNPERKIPMRRGTSSQPDQYSESWAEMQLTPESENIKELLDGKLVEMLSADVASADRWAFEQNQGSLMTVLYEDLILAPLLQEMLSGYFTSSQTIVEMYTSIVNSIVGYEFPFEVVPTPTP